MTSLARFIATQKGKPCTIRGSEIEIEGTVIRGSERDTLMAEYDTWKAQQEQAELIDEFSAAIQRHIDARAQERQYDSIYTAVTYRDCPVNAQFASEGSALHTWRAEVWTYAVAELDKVRNGERAIPTVEDFIAELPAFAWPDEDAPLSG